MEPSPGSTIAPIQVQYRNRFLQYKPIASEKSKGPREKGRKKIPDSEKVGKARSYKGRNFGKLKNLMKMPLDVFYEIVSHIEPLDLLQLSRASVYFHDLLTTKDARPYWRATRRLLKIPDCPPDLSEMQYASLIFEMNCFACGAPSKCVSYTLKVRFCTPCWQLNVEKGKKVLKPYNNARKNKKLFGQEFFTLFISHHDVPTHGSIEYDQVVENLKYSMDLRIYNLFYRAELETNYEEYAKLSGTALIKFKEERKAVMDEALRFACSIQKWERKYRKQRSREASDNYAQAYIAKVEKEATITERLLALGYEKSDFPFGYKWDRLIAPRAELTEKYWEKTLLPKLKAALEKQRKEVEQRELELRLSARASEFYSIFETLAFPPKSLIPHIQDCLYSPLSFILGFLEEEEARFPVTVERVQGVMQKLMDFVAEFDRQFREQVSSTALQALSVIKPAESPQVLLQRASTLFTCDYWCGEVHTFSLLAEHIVAKHPPSKEGCRRFLSDEEGFNLSYDARASGFAAKMLQIAGLAADATMDDVQEFERGANLVCLCGNPKFVQPVTFVDLVNHVFQEIDSFRESRRDERLRNEHELYETANFIGVLRNGESIDTLEMRNQLGSELTSAPTDTLSCRVCPWAYQRMYKLTQAEMVWHLNAKHGLKAEDRYVRVGTD